MELLLNYLEKREVESDEFLDDLAFTLGERRSIFPWRATVSAFSPTELIEALSTENFKFSKAAKSVATGFVFTGQGAQWPTMGKELVAAYPVFKNSLLQSEGYLRKFGAPRSLLDELLRDVQNSRIGIALFSQPLCTALQIALVDLLATWNIRPVSVTGHSSGEIAAAYAAGALTQESALAAAYYRGVASTSIKDVQGLPLGAMLAVGMSKEEADEMISKLQKGIVNVACVNSPNSVTVSGDSSAIDELEEMVKSKGVFARKLAVDTAYHSHHMKPVAESYLNALGTLKAGVTEGVEFYSSVTGKRTDLSEHSAAYWVANLVSPVLFSDSIQNLCLGTGSKRRTRRGAKTAVDILIEVGPHSALSGPIKQNLQSHPQLSSSGIEYLSVLTRSKDAVSTSLALAGTLFRRGVDVNLHSINCPIGDESNKVLVDLPPYPWNHSKLYWARALDFPNDKRDDFPRSDILGLPARFSSSSEPQWRNVMRTSEIPWIQDHNIQGNTVCPAACFLAMAIEAAHQRAVKRGVDILGYRLREVTIGHALILSQDDEVETLLSLRPYNESNRITSDSWDEFVISSSTDGKSWTEHCRGLISVTKHSETTEVDGGRETQEEKKAYARIITDFNDACTTEVGKTEIYEPLSKLGLNFGPIFANMSRARSSDDKCVAEVLVPDTAAVMPANFEYSFVLHPATLDSFIHAVFPVGSGHKNIEQGTPVPTFIEEMYVSHNTPKEPQHKFTVYAKVEWKDLGNSAIKGLAQTTNSLSIFDAEEDNPMPAATITGLRFSSLPRPENQTDKVAKIAHKIVWEVAPDFMSAAQLKELTAPFRHSPKVKDQGRMIQQVAFYYAEQALKEVSLDQVSSEITHLKKLHQVLGHFCETVRNGHMGLFDTSSWLDLDTAGRTALCNEVSQTSYGILCYIGERLPQILRNEVDPLSLMMEEGRLEKHYRENQVLSQCYEQAAAYAALLANKNPFLNVLEIGAGTGGATFPILDALNGGDGSVPRFANYDFTDISAGFFEKVVDKTKRFGDLVKFKKLDIESGPAEQGFQAGSYDLIIAANVLHATKAMKNTLKRVRSLLKPGGSLILIEITISNIATSLIFGTLPGWWAAEEESRKMGPLLTEVEWDTALREADFNGLDATLWDTPDAESHHSSTMIATARAEDAAHFERNVTIVTEAGARDPCVEELQGLLGTLGINTKVSNLISIQPENQVCVVMSELTDSVLRNPTSEEFLAMKSIFLQSAGVLWVTRGALIASPSPSSNLVTGLTRTVRAEKGDTMLVNLDLDPKASLSGLQDAEAIFSIFKRNFAIGSVEQIDLDAEYAVRDGLIMIPRVVEDSALTTFVASATVNPVPEMQPFLQDGRSLRAEIKTPGFLDSLQFIDDERMSGPLPDDHVEIEVKAIGMNFRDVMSASGQIDPYPLGCECSGVVTAIGKAVNGLSAGDQVIANVIGGCVCNRVRTAAVGVEHVPKDMPFEIAASLPIVYFTAYYAVMKVARLSKGETVLIHAASGGLGQAIINLCQLVGAEIYATVGTIEKKKLLMDRFGIAEDHIFSSRDGTFAKGIMRMTGGGGVDVIMNSVSGDALRLTWNCIAPFGRFIELGKRDMTINSRLEMRHFEKNVSFTGLDVPLHTHFDEKRRIWGELMSMYQKGEIKPPYPITTYGISETEKALRIMQTGKHTGKLVLVPRAGEIVKVIPQNIDHRLPRADASYLLIGGLGGIGRAIALWMIEWGARNLIFVSPSGLDKEKAKECVEMLKDKGASVSVFKGDAAKLEDVDRVLENVKSLPPIRGVVNAAMVPKVRSHYSPMLQDTDGEGRFIRKFDA
jgi:acyl transferase domain-containing protein/NADPH:quinone reductase-like Zn-dependent oxidoreductase